jgi:hydrogenase nickel incorporation protein HypB
MCATCGCSSPSTHDHDPGHDHGRTVSLETSLLAQNDRYAERNRGMFQALKVASINLMSSPGSGKTAILERTLASLRDDLRTAVVVGDLATENDADRIRAAGGTAHQIMTGAACHLDAHAVQHALEHLDLPSLDLLLIENVGNLVCPASFDLGQDAQVVVHAVTEGEDKPLKYPVIFQGADAVILNKIDLADAVGFDRDTALANLRTAAPNAELFEVSARTGEGFEPWLAWLRHLVAHKAGTPHTHPHAS